MFPIHISLGSIHMAFYEGLYFVIAILLGLILGTRKLEKHGINEDKYLGVVILSILGALVGGRMFHVLFWGNDYYMRNPGEILAMWKGGISITGGLFGAFTVAWIACKATKQSIIRYLALLAPVILIAQGVGRFGCFLNGDAFGLPTNLPWGVEFARYGTTLFSFQQEHSMSSAAWQWCASHGLVAADSIKTVPLHPTQLYEAFFDFALAAVLALLTRTGTRDKTVAFLYIAGYSFFRFAVEYVRGDREQIVVFNTSAIQIFLLGVGILFVILAFTGKAPEAAAVSAVKPGKTSKTKAKTKD